MSGLVAERIVVPWHHMHLPTACWLLLEVLDQASSLLASSGLCRSIHTGTDAFGHVVVLPTTNADCLTVAWLAALVELHCRFVVMWQF